MGTESEQSKDEESIEERYSNGLEDQDSEKFEDEMEGKYDLDVMEGIDGLKDDVQEFSTDVNGALVMDDGIESEFADGNLENLGEMQAILTEEVEAGDTREAGEVEEREDTDEPDEPEEEEEEEAEKQKQDEEDTGVVEEGLEREYNDEGEKDGQHAAREVIESMATDEDPATDKGLAKSRSSVDKYKKDKETADETQVSQPKVENEPELVIPQTHEIVIPSYSKWFHLNKIHEIEKKSLPEFFTNRIPSKTPQVYVKYRNFMVNSYRLNPNEYFTVTSARRNLCGDAGSIFRVHKFLSKWGLINYQVNARDKPKAVEPPFTGEYSTRHDAPRGLFPFQSYKPAVQVPDMSRLKKMMTQLRDPMPSSADSNNPNIKKEEEIDPLQNGKRSSPPGFSSLSKAPKKPKLQEMIDKGWTKEDLAKLLKSLQRHGADWMQIAKDVGNKTPEQCILRFIQLPIEDTFLEDGDNLGPLKYGAHLPFSKSDNPVMSTLAFLLGLVDPQVVRSMTKRAVRTLEEVDKKKMAEVDAAEAKDAEIKSTDAEPTKTQTAYAETVEEKNTDVKDNDTDAKEPQVVKATEESVSEVIKEATEAAVASIGVRSHVFATQEERRLNSISNDIINLQMKKVELKLKLLDTMEKSLELERKSIQKQQEEILVQRFAFSKHAVTMLDKFEQLLNEHQDPVKLKENIDSLRKLIMTPPVFSIGPAPDVTLNTASNVANQTPGTVPLEGSVAPYDEPCVKPVSIDAPQFYRYWSG